MDDAADDGIGIRLLGAVEVAAPAGPGGPKQRLLLAVLALRLGEAVPTDVLVDVLWSGHQPDDPTRSLQVHVSKLRAVLAPLGATIEHRGSGAYLLRADPDAVDVHRFERLVREASLHVDEDAERARDTLTEALALWSGRPLGGLSDHPALRGELRRLEELHLRAAESLMEVELRLGDHDHVTAELYRLTGEHPLRERFWMQLMVALYRSGRPADAVEAYGRARTALADELGTDPSPELRELHAAILRQDAGLGSSDGGSVGLDPADRLVPDRRTLAVLPFEVLAGGEEVALLAVGLHNDLLTELSGSADLRVISRTSVIEFQRAGGLLPRVARDLGAGTVVEGTLQATASQLRMTIRMTDARHGTDLLAMSYDVELSADDLFTVQRRLARDIAGSLSTEVGAPGVAGSGGARTDDLEAYRIVAAGRHHFEVKTQEAFRRAIDCFHEATELDPTYPDAWSGLADALVSMDAYGHGDRHALLPRAERAVHRALALDAGSAEARTALGVLHVAYQEGPAALDAFRDVLSTHPNAADPHNWSSWVSLIVGDAAAGLTHARRAVELDPRSAEAHGHLALAEAATGSPGDGAAAARQARRLSPYTTADLYEGLCSYEAGRYEEARRLLEPLSAKSREDAPVPWTGHGPDALLGLTYAALGDRGAVHDLQAVVDTAGFPFDAGLLHLADGDLGSARQAFEQVGRLGAWPCLLIHNHLAPRWSAVPEAHRRLVAAARRSWSMPPP